MEIKTIQHEKEASLALKGRFDFNCHRDFKIAYMQLLETNELFAITVDLKEVAYMDSSALGMLLLLKERAVEGGKKVVLNCGANATVRDLLALVAFAKIFEIT